MSFTKHNTICFKKLTLILILRLATCWVWQWGQLKEITKKTRQRLLKEKFIPRWQDFFLLAKKKIIKRWVTHQNFDLRRAFQPYEILIKRSPKFEIWGPPSWRTLGSLVTSVWRQCAQPKFVKSLKTSCFFVSELHKKTWPQKTQSETKKIKMLSDLICLPSSGWAHWCHVLDNRLLGILQDGGPRFSNFELL